MDDAMSSTTRTAALHAELQAVRAEYEQRIQTAAREEFPIGAIVEWEELFGPRKVPIRLRGKVRRIGWNADVITSPNGPVCSVQLHQLVPVNV